MITPRSEPTTVDSGRPETPLLERLLRPPSWHSEAACARPEHAGVDFFPERGGRGLAALAVCAVCSVSDECLQFALDDPSIVGIWGGTTGERRAQLRRRGAA